MEVKVVAPRIAVVGLAVGVGVFAGRKVYKRLKKEDKV